MGNVLEASVELINEKLMFKCEAGENPPIITDYIPPLGDLKGYMPLQLFLISMATCTGGVIAPFLRRSGKHVGGLQMKASGVRREQHPTGFEKIHLDIVLKSRDATEEDVTNILKLAEDTYCPVWSMIKGNVDVSASVSVIRE